MIYFFIDAHATTWRVENRPGDYRSSATIVSTTDATASKVFAKWSYTEIMNEFGPLTRVVKLGERFLEVNEGEHEVSVNDIVRDVTPGDPHSWADELDFLWRHHESQMTRLIDDVSNNGVNIPIEIAVDNESRLRMWDGHHRVAAALALQLHLQVHIVTDQSEKMPDVDFDFIELQRDREPIRDFIKGKII